MPFDLIADKLDTSEFDFPVEMLSEFWDKDGNHYRIPTGLGQFVVRTDQMQPLHIGGSRYTVTPHAKAFSDINDALEASGLDLSDLTVRDRLYDNGAKAHRQITFNKLTIEPKRGDRMAFKLDLYNSYDGTWAFTQTASSLRLICLNGMTRADNVSATRLKHTNIIDTSAQAQKMIAAADVFHADEGRYARLMQRHVTEKAANHLFSRTLAHMPSPGDASRVNGKQLDNLMSYWNREVRDLGANLWATFNAATYWSTHIEGKAYNSHVTQRRREDAVAAMQRSETWQELENA